MPVLKNIMLLLLYVLSFVNLCTPKLNIIIFFTNNSETNDNNLALLYKIYKLKLAKNYRIYFFSKDGDKYNHLKGVVYKTNIFAPIYFLFAKYCFYDAGTLKIKPTNRQYVISLWHGVPLKKIGLMLNEQSSNLDRYNDFTKILVPSVNWVDKYKKAFGCNDDQILINGFPRNDYLFHPAFDRLPELEVGQGFNKRILWMPTFRNSIGGRYADGENSTWDLPVFNNLRELESFNQKLLSVNAQLIIKLHPYSILNINAFDGFSNIKFIRNSDLNSKGIINYEFISCFDALITDYSSVFFDYLLTNKPIGFSISDLESYRAKRGFMVPDPEYYLVGPLIANDRDMLYFINNLNEVNKNFMRARDKIKNEVHQFDDDFSTERLLKEIHLI